MSLLLSTATYGQGQALVLLHGWGFSKQIWSPLIPKLMQHFQITVIDLPGHGQSPLLAQALTAEKLAEHLVQSTPANALWLGWSLGGILALAVAHHHPQHVKQLLLVASTPKFVASEDWVYGMQADVLAKFSAQLQAKPEVTLSKFIALQTLGTPHAREETRKLLEYLHQHLPTEQGLMWGLEMLKTLDLRSALDSSYIKTSCPVHALFGAKDTLVALALAEYLPQTYPHIKTEVLSEAAHMPFFSHPELFLQWLKRSCQH